VNASTDCKPRPKSVNGSASPSVSAEDGAATSPYEGGNGDPESVNGSASPSVSAEDGAATSPFEGGNG
jgi:hypothetical protein